MCADWSGVFGALPTAFGRMALLAVCLGAAPVAARGGDAPAIRIAYVAPRARQPVSRTAIFVDRFDTDPAKQGRYLEVVSRDGGFAWAPGEGIGGGGAMRATFQPAQVDVGSLKVLFGRNPRNRGVHRYETFREIYWRVYVKHEAGWQGNPAKLARATCLATPAWAQGFIAHVWGGKGDVLCIDPASGIRASRRVSTKYIDFPNLRWLGFRNGRTPIFAAAESGRWVCVGSQVRLNTPGRADGIFRLWVDGILEAERTDLDWHGQWDEYAVDAVFLENYWNGGSTRRQSRWFADLAIDCAPIGPIPAEDVPALWRTPVPCDAWQAQVASSPEAAAPAWTSSVLPGGVLSVRVAQPGSAAGLQCGVKPGATYWSRVRERSKGGGWSAWSAWHAPFVLPAP